MLGLKITPPFSSSLLKDLAITNFYAHLVPITELTNLLRWLCKEGSSLEAPLQVSMSRSLIQPVGTGGGSCGGAAPQVIQDKGRQNPQEFCPMTVLLLAPAQPLLQTARENSRFL